MKNAENAQKKQNTKEMKGEAAKDLSPRAELKALRALGLLGVISFLSYLAAVVFSPLAYPGYDWMSQAVSDLSAVTAPSRELWDQLSCLYSLCGIVSVMAVSVYVADKKCGNKVLRAGIYLFAVMNWISAVGYKLFPLSEAGTGMTGFSDIMHVYVVTVSVVVTSIASLVLIIIGGFRKGTNRSIAVLAAAALLMMFVGAIGTNVVPQAYFGIVERFSVFAATGFNAMLGVWLFLAKL